ncbi:MAG: hypothetical protein SFT81_00370 [Candidatus Caenarcaniphilales bacterium]|nr:hypothetical protein [Candidatus Caenarcaniphilales bacterium]
MGVGLLFEELPVEEELPEVPPVDVLPDDPLDDELDEVLDDLHSDNLRQLILVPSVQVLVVLK